MNRKHANRIVRERDEGDHQSHTFEFIERVLSEATLLREPLALIAKRHRIPLAAVQEWSRSYPDWKMNRLEHAASPTPFHALAREVARQRMVFRELVQPTWRLAKRKLIGSAIDALQEKQADLAELVAASLPPLRKPTNSKRIDPAFAELLALIRHHSVSHCPNFFSVRWFGEAYEFGNEEGACVAVLWESWTRGGSFLRTKEILSRAGLPFTTEKGNEKRLRNVFKSGRNGLNRAWGSMIRGEDVTHVRGTFRLFPDPIQA